MTPSGTARSRAQGTTPRRVVFPDGLQEIEVTFRAEKGAVDFHRFSERFPKDSVASRPKRGKSVRLALAGAPLLSGGHAHFEARESGPGGSFVASLSLIPGRHESPLTSVPSIAEAIESIVGALKVVPEQFRLLVSAHYALSLKEWTPTLALPFTPQSMTGQLAGLPQICGVDIAFQEQSAAQCLQRAFLTTYDGIDRMVVRMLLVKNLALDATLVRNLVSLANDHLPLLAQRRGEATV